MCDLVVFFFFNDTATTEIYTLSLHDALPILGGGQLFDDDGMGALDDVDEHPHVLAGEEPGGVRADHLGQVRGDDRRTDRKSTRLNSSHANISYAVFCLKKKKITHNLQLSIKL